MATRNAPLVRSATHPPLMQLYTVMAQSTTSPHRRCISQHYARAREAMQQDVAAEQPRMHGLYHNLGYGEFM
eukprot:2777728-Pyramimonas_sp.AAC.1